MHRPMSKVALRIMFIYIQTLVNMAVDWITKNI